MEEPLSLESPVQKNFFGLTPITYLRAVILLLIYTTTFFFVFYYDRSNTPNQIESFWSQYYFLYFVIALCFSIWRSVSPSFCKQLITLAGILVLIDVVTMLIPAGFGSLGQALLYFEFYALPLIIAVIIIFYLTNFLINWTKTLIFLIIIFLLPLIYFIYANNHDLGVRSRISYENNSMFETIEECSAYIFDVRESDCRKDFMEQQGRWDSDITRSDINLVSGQVLDPGSANYKFFPKENIKDVVVGTGELATLNNTAVINVLSVTIRGKTYPNLISLKSRTADPRTFKNKVIKMYTPVYDSVKNGDEYSYFLGVIGMKVGGTRDITFKSSVNFWFSGTEPAILINADEPVIYRVELLSLVKGLNYYQENLTP